MDTKVLLDKLRELIQAEVEAGIAYSEEDEEGYRGTYGTVEKKNADRVFAELVEMMKGGKICWPQ